MFFNIYHIIIGASKNQSEAESTIDAKMNDADQTGDIFFDLSMVQHYK